MDAPGSAAPADDDGAAPAGPAPTRQSRRARREATTSGPLEVDVDVVVIGAGQAGLAAGYHLSKAGFAAVGSQD